MSLISAQGVTFGYGGDPVLHSVDLTIDPGDRVGLVGANGCGKSTLIRLLVGEETPQHGRIVTRAGARVAQVHQFFPDNDDTATALRWAIDEVLATRARLHDLEERMGHETGGELTRTLETYGALREEYEAIDGDVAEERGLTLLSRVGMGHAADTPVGVLSGGERNRLQIARALAVRPDLVILDEPGNHLDVWGLAWLERALIEVPAAVLIVSHNRYLLDRVTSRTLELRAGTVTSWSGNYSAFRAAQLRDAVARAADARADKKHLDRLERQVQYLAQLARAVPSPSIGKRLKARRTQLRMAEESARERPDLTEDRAAIRLDANAVRADVALELRGYSLEIAGRRLIEDASLLVASGERVALVGPNGCGKTTFLREIVSTGSWDHDHLRVGPSMRIGYCAQHRELFPPEQTLFDAISRAGAGGRDRVFALLSRYLFAYRDLDRTVGSLSGGEHNRLQLAHAEVTGANVLVLDEPTNHLDIPGREAVEEALLAFRGTVLVVSHDRYFLDTVATRVIAFHGTALESHDGGFSDYWYSIGRFRGEAEPSPGREASVEERLLALETEKVRLERELSRAYQRDRLEEAASLSRQLDGVTRRFQRLYRQWE